jgi:hypothetical protein
VFDFVFFDAVAYSDVFLAVEWPCDDRFEVEGLIAVDSHGDVAVFLTVFGLRSV